MRWLWVSPVRMGTSQPFPAKEGERVNFRVPALVGSVHTEPRSVDLQANKHSHKFASR